MKHIFFVISLLFLADISFAAEVKTNPCITPESAIGIGLMDAMEKNMRIDIHTLQRNKTKVSLLENTKVSEKLAEQFAIADEKKSPDSWLSVKDYKKIYLEDNARNLIIRYDYENKQSKHNIFIVSALVNDNECSVRFNGYLIVQRQF